MKSQIVGAIDTARAYLRLGGELSNNRQILPPRDSDMRILLLVNEFAPAVAGGVYRPAALARYAARRDWKVTVVTGPAPDRPTDAGLSLLEYVGQEVAVARYTPSRLRPSFRLFPQIDGGLLGALDMVDMARTCFGNDLPRTIIASGPTFSSFVAGYMLARRTNARLILEYRDEWNECPFDFVVKSPSNRRWETRCLSRANQIVVTTVSQCEHIERSFGHVVASKCAVIPNGWEPAEAATTEIRGEFRRKKAVLTFAGKLGGHTDPGPFLDTLIRVFELYPDLRNQLIFRFIGSKRQDAMDRLMAFPIPGVIEIMPVVPLPEAIRLMRESAALMLFHDRRFERYLPGKIYEYAASAAPILLIDDVGESDKLVRSLALGWSVKSDDVKVIADVLRSVAERQYLARHGQDRRSPEIDEWLKAHTREHLANQFLERCLNT